MIVSLSLILLLVGYLFAISKTVSAYRLWKEYRTSISNGQNVLDVISKKRNDLVILNEFLGLSFEMDDDSNQLLKEVESFLAEKSTFLKSFPKSEIEGFETYSVETTIIQVEGQFLEIVELLYFLEYQNKIGNVSSVTFEKQKDVRSQVEKLIAEVHVQNINLIK